MPYRRTENVVRRLAAREHAILDAAMGLARDGGMAAVQVAAVAERAQIAAGTVYRYFPSKTELIAELVARLAQEECAAMQAAGDAAPGPLSALAAAIAAFAARALRARKLAWATIAEPVEADIEPVRLNFRCALIGELARRIQAAIDAGHLPEQDVQRAGPAILGILVDGLIGPVAPVPDGEAAARTAVQDMTLMALRALGVVDARARGLVAQVALP
jgi:AcrR family transcriptional regulator